VSTTQLANIKPVNPPKEKEIRNPITKNMEVRRLTGELHMVKIQLNILIPVGIAITEVALV
jgi:hypothetical protein